MPKDFLTIKNINRKNRKNRTNNIEESNQLKILYENVTVNHMSEENGTRKYYGLRREKLYQYLIMFPDVILNIIYDFICFGDNSEKLKVFKQYQTLIMEKLSDNRIVILTTEKSQERYTGFKQNNDRSFYNIYLKIVDLKKCIECIEFSVYSNISCVKVTQDDLILIGMESKLGIFDVKTMKYKEINVRGKIVLIHELASKEIIYIIKYTFYEVYKLNLNTGINSIISASISISTKNFNSLTKVRNLMANLPNGEFIAIHNDGNLILWDRGFKIPYVGFKREGWEKGEDIMEIVCLNNGNVLYHSYNEALKNYLTIIDPKGRKNIKTFRIDHLNILQILVLSEEDILLNVEIKSKKNHLCILNLKREEIKIFETINIYSSGIIGILNEEHIVVINKNDGEYDICLLDKNNLVLHKKISNKWITYTNIIVIDKDRIILPSDRDHLEFLY